MGEGTGLIGHGGLRGLLYDGVEVVDCFRILSKLKVG